MLTPSAEGTTVEPDRRRAPKMARDQQNRRCGHQATRHGERKPRSAAPRQLNRAITYECEI